MTGVKTSCGGSGFKSAAFDSNKGLCFKERREFNQLLSLCSTESASPREKERDWRQIKRELLGLGEDSHLCLRVESLGDVSFEHTLLSLHTRG